MSSKLSGFVPISYIFFILSFSVVTTAPMRGGGRGMRGIPRGRGNPRMNDMFRSRKQNTSRPPSMHVDDFMAMEHAKTQDSPPPMRRTGPKVYSTSFLLIIWCCFVLKYVCGQSVPERTVWWCSLEVAFGYNNEFYRSCSFCTTRLDICVLRFCRVLHQVGRWTMVQGASWGIRAVGPPCQGDPFVKVARPSTEHKSCFALWQY